jgi:hypothetical protein
MRSKQLQWASAEERRRAPEFFWLSVGFQLAFSWLSVASSKRILHLWGSAKRGVDIPGVSNVTISKRPGWFILLQLRWETGKELTHT